MKNGSPTWTRFVAISSLFLIVAAKAFGQEVAIQYRHTVTAGVAVNEIITECGDQTSFALGFDYLYRLDPKWELGFQLDLNYDRNFENHVSDAIAPIVSYSVTDRLPSISMRGHRA